MLLGHPHKCGGRGEHILHCLQALVPLLNEDFIELWDAIIPKLLTYLDGKKIINYNLLYFITVEHPEGNSWDQKHWEDLVLKVSFVNFYVSVKVPD